MGFTITSEQIVWVCSFIICVCGAWKIVKEFRKPNNDVRTSVERHEELLANDDERLKQLDLSNQMILKCLLVIMNHEITGNGIENMKKARDELQTFIIDR